MQFCRSGQYSLPLRPILIILNTKHKGVLRVVVKLENWKQSWTYGKVRTISHRHPCIHFVNSWLRPIFKTNFAVRDSSWSRQFIGKNNALEESFVEDIIVYKHLGFLRLEPSRVVYFPVDNVGKNRECWECLLKRSSVAEEGRKRNVTGATGTPEWVYAGVLFLPLKLMKPFSVFLDGHR